MTAGDQPAAEALSLESDPSVLQPTRRQSGVARLARNRLGMISLAFLLVLCLVALTSLFWTPYSIYVQGTAAPYDGPSAMHWFGVDAAGRDIVSRLMVGARVSLEVAFGTQLLAVPFGVTIGFLAGYRGGRIDAAVSTVINIFYGIPGVLVAMLLVVMLGAGIDKIIVAIVIASWMDIARLARGQMLTLKERSYIDAARAVGVGGIRIVGRHILPNCFGPLTVQATFGFSSVILFEAFLSYLGLGVAPPTPSWGSMAADGFAAIRLAPHMVAAPAIAISLTLVAISYLGDALSDAPDGKSASFGVP